MMKILASTRLLPDDKDIGWVPYVWLVYLLAVPLNAYFLPPTPRLWIMTIGGTLCFLVLYFRAYWVEGRDLAWIIAAITALGVVIGPVNPSSATFFIYAASFAGWLERPAAALGVIGGLLVVIALETWALHFPAAFGLYCGVLVMVIGAVNIYYGQRHRDRKKLQRAEEEVRQLARIAERERIARDLHDVLGHTLSVIVLKSELASKLADVDRDRAVQEIKDVERISRDALAQVRTTIEGYHARSLRAEAQQATSALEAAGVDVHCRLAPASIPAAHEGVLALALREAVTNVIRHAKATSCTLTLQVVRGGCQLEIRDDGCGRLAPEGVGLSGMRRRVEALGGTLQRDAASGTRLLITLPEVSA
jgi:two-component system, NarL family, sensor histidine kinase DesK